MNVHEWGRMQTMVAEFSRPNLSNKRAGSDDNLDSDSDYEESAEEEDNNETATDQGSDCVLTYTDDDDDGPGTPSNDGAAGSSKYDAIIILDSDSETDFSFEDKIHTRSNKMAGSMNRFRGSSKLFSAPPQHHTTEEVTVISEQSESREAHPSNALQRRREEMAAAMSMEMMNRGQGNLPTKPACSPNPSQRASISPSQTMKVVASVPTEITSEITRIFKVPGVRDALQALRPPGECVDDAFAALPKSLKDPIPARKKECTINDNNEDEQEIYSAVQDGSYKDAVLKLFEENELETSSTHRISPTSKGDQAAEATVKPNLRKRPRLIEDSTYAEADKLRENVKRLRCDKIKYIDRIINLLEEQTAMVARETALLKRVALLEAKLNDV